jgi:hypothetical protein
VERSVDPPTAAVQGETARIGGPVRCPIPVERPARRNAARTAASLGGYRPAPTLWVYTNGCDAFLSAEDVVELWELRTTVTDRVACGLGQHIGLSEWSVPSGGRDSYVRQPA